MFIEVRKQSGVPLYRQISEEIKRKIIDGSLAWGSILPSERELAAQLGVHRNTVVRAYNDLKDQEMIFSTAGQGYFVMKKESEADPAWRKKVNWQALIKDEYQDIESSFDDIFMKFAAEKNISFSSGAPPRNYDEERLAAQMSSIIKETVSSGHFLTPYQGDRELIKSITGFLRNKGIKARPGQIQVLYETNQAVDFLVTTMVEPGDTVFIEEPVSPDVYRAIELAGARTVTIPIDENGMVCDNLENLVLHYKPKFIYVSGSYQDPTGMILSLERRKLLIEISGRHRIPIIEDDSASELSFEGDQLPSLKALGGDNVIYIYSFGISFIPGLSLAFVVGPEPVIRGLAYLVSLRVMNIDWFLQKLIARYLRDGSYRSRVRQIVEENRVKRDMVIRSLDELRREGFDFRTPGGGAYIWIRLPEGVTGRDFVRAAEEEGLSLVPGDVFFVDPGRNSRYIRLCFSYETEERVREGMEIFSETALKLAHKISG